MDTGWAPALSIRCSTAWKLKVFCAQKRPEEREGPAVYTRPLPQAVKLSKKVTRRSANCYAKWMKANSSSRRQLQVSGLDTRCAFRTLIFAKGVTNFACSKR